MSEPLGTAVSSDSGRTYELVGELGRGGFGAVYKARLVGEAGFARLVAIKMLHDESAGRPEYANRLRDEARLLARLRHRAIVAVDDLVCLDGRWAVVMEYVEGEDLLSLIRRGPIPPRAAAEIALEVASGLRVIHGAKDPATKRLLGIVHRDLKPSNIRITPHGEVKLLDFGIARAAFPGREAVTGSVRFESVGYVAPERMFGLDTPQSDIFSLGVVLYECLTGQRMGPLPERQGAYEAVRDRALENLAGALRDPEPARRVLLRMLAFEDRDRPTAAVAADLLRDLAQELPGPWLAGWASDLFGRSRYGDPEDYGVPVAPAPAPVELQAPASTESLAVAVEPEQPPATVGLDLPVARPPEAAGAADALVPAEEDVSGGGLDAEAPAPAARALPERPPAPPPPPATAAHPLPAPAPPRAAVPMSAVLPPVAGWLLGGAALLLLIGLVATVLLYRLRPEVFGLPATAEQSAPPAEPAETVVEAPPPVEAPVLQPTAPVEPPPAEASPAEASPAAEPAPSSAPVASATPAAPAAASSTPAPAKAASGARPRARPTATAQQGRIAVKGTFDQAELVGAAGRLAPGEVPAGSYALRVRFGADLAWVETGLVIAVEAGQSVTVQCSYESEACRISR